MDPQPAGQMSQEVCERFQPPSFEPPARKRPSIALMPTGSPPLPPNRPTQPRDSRHQPQQYGTTYQIRTPQPAQQRPVGCDAGNLQLATGSQHAQRTDCDEALDAVFHNLGVIKASYSNAYLASQQKTVDLKFANDHIAQLQEALKSQTDSEQRVRQAVSAFLQTERRLMQKAESFSGRFHGLQDKVQQVDELIAQLNTLKVQTQDKLSAKEAQIQELEAKQRSFQVRSEELLDQKNSLARQIEDLKGEYEVERAASEKVKAQMVQTREHHEAEMAGLQAEKNEMSEKIEAFMRDKFAVENGHKIQMKSTCQNLALSLGCRSPEYFGDGSSDAFKNVLQEIIAEHLQAHQLELSELNGRIEELQNKILQREAEVKSLEEAVASNDELNSKLQVTSTRSCFINSQRAMSDLAERDKKLKAYEDRISCLYSEGMTVKAKVADLQGLSAIQGVLEELVTGQPLKELEYEDFKAILAEKLNHSSCRGQVLAMQAEIKGTQEKYAQDRQNLIADYEDKLKSQDATWRQKYDALSDSVGKASRPSSRSAKMVSKDKAVDGLIELIERDTQELRQISSKKPSSPKKKYTPVPPSSISKRVRGSGSRTSARVYSKHSPISHASETDLWSVFAKRQDQV